MTEINVLNFDLYIFYCKCLHMSVLFLLQMSTHVSLVPTTNVYTCWSCFYCKCLHMSVLFQLQMSTPVGPVPTANVYTCWSCNCRKCLHMLVQFLRQMSACVGPVATAKVCLCWFCYYCKFLHVFFIFFKILFLFPGLRRVRSSPREFLLYVQLLAGCRESNPSCYDHSQVCYTHP